MLKKLKKIINFKTLYIIFGIVLVIPTILFYINNETVLKFNSWFTYLLRQPQSLVEQLFNMLMFGIIIVGSTFSMIMLFKKAEKEFKNIKILFGFIVMISILFAIAIPFTTSDIFYYMGTGQIDAKYGVNPYYTSVAEVLTNNPQDEILQRVGVWSNAKVVYGPLWTFICKCIADISFNNVNISLYVFKIFAIIIHTLTCFIIYKLTGKKKMVILYGLNPFVLFELITNVHNDLYLVFFTLLSIYLLIKRKKLFLGLIAAACAASIKYVIILILPFIMIYYFRKYNIAKRLLYSSFCAIFFITILGLIYMIYLRDLNMLANIFIQQGKYRESIITIILVVFKKIAYPNIFIYVKNIFILVFLGIYWKELIYFLIKKKISIKQLMHSSNIVMLFFILLIITNLCPWYMSWLIPAMFWQKGKTIKLIIYIQISYELVLMYNFLLHSENYKIGLWYLPIMFLGYIGYKAYNRRKNGQVIIS